MTSLGSSLRIGARIIIALVLVSSVAWARAVVLPNRSTPGAYEKYSLRVVNEREVPTLRVEIHFPQNLRVVSFGDVPGWNLQILTDSTQRITGAVWTGVHKPRHRLEDARLLHAHCRHNSTANTCLTQVALHLAGGAPVCSDRIGSGVETTRGRHQPLEEPRN